MATVADQPPSPGSEERPDSSRMTVVEHLAELRRRIVVAVLAVAVGGIVAFVLYGRILDFLIGPYTDITGRTSLLITDPLEGFATRLKIAGYGGLFLASPVVLWQLWRFITPGLHPNEKRYAIPFIVSSIVLFSMGAALALAVLPKTLEFLVGVGGPNLETFFSPAKYLSLVTLMMVAFGIAFEFPVLLVFLQLAGVVPSARLRSWRRYAIVLIAVLAAVITPSQDPYSMLAIAIPMYVFYEGAIVVGRVLKK